MPKRCRNGGEVLKCLRKNKRFCLGLDLTELDLTVGPRYNRIGPEGGRAVAEILKRNSTLTTLDMSGNHIRDGGAKALAEAVAMNSVMTTLDLSWNHIGDEGTKAMVEALKRNSTLTTFVFGYNDMDPYSATAMAEVVKQRNSPLTTLDLRWNHIGSGVHALAEALKVNSTLTALDLCGNDIEDEGAKALAEAVRVNSTLITLNLRWNQIGPEGAKALAEAVSLGNSTLITLDIKYNSIRGFTNNDMYIHGSDTRDLIQTMAKEIRIRRMETRKRECQGIRLMLLSYYFREESPFRWLPPELVRMIAKRIHDAAPAPNFQIYV